MRAMQFFKDLTAPAVVAGFVAVLVGFTSSVAIVFQAAQAFGATPELITSWMWALGLGMGVTCIGLSPRYRMPVVTAWSTPGAAMLITSAAGVSSARHQPDSPSGAALIALAGLLAALAWFAARGLRRRRQRADLVQRDALTGLPDRRAVLAFAQQQFALCRRLDIELSSIPFNRFIIAQINERLGQFIGMMENERLLDTDARLARNLAAMFNPVLYPGTGTELQISQEEIGYLAGLSRQRANQALSDKLAAHPDVLEYGGITVLDLEGLRNYEG